MHTKNNTNYRQQYHYLFAVAYVHRRLSRHRLVSSAWSSLLISSQRSFLLKRRESLFVNDAAMIVNAIFKIEITSPNAGMMRKRKFVKKKKNGFVDNPLCFKG